MKNLAADDTRKRIMRRYADPPVVEALCECFFQNSAWDSTIPGTFYEQVKAEFPKKSELKRTDVHIHLGPSETTTQTALTESRTRFSSQDDTRLVQVERDLVVVNQLKPYPQFEAWRPLVISMVKHYNELAKPQAIVRIGVRYINRIVVPVEGHEMANYFKLYPEVPTELGGAHGTFFMRVQIPAHHTNHGLIVTFGSPRMRRMGHRHTCLICTTSSSWARRSLQRSFRNVLTRHTQMWSGRSRTSSLTAPERFFERQNSDDTVKPRRTL